jgi:hypothetical protein
MFDLLKCKLSDFIAGEILQIDISFVNEKIITKEISNKEDIVTLQSFVENNKNKFTICGLYNYCMEELREIKADFKFSNFINNSLIAMILFMRFYMFILFHLHYLLLSDFKRQLQIALCSSTALQIPPNAGRLADVKPTLSESPVGEIFRFGIIASEVTMIAAAQMVKSFSDFMSPPFRTIFSNTAATVATMPATKTVAIQRARKPAGSSSLWWNIFMYSPAAAMKILNTTAQYFMLFKAPPAFDENSLFCPMYPSNRNVLYSATKNAIDTAYPYKMNGSE